MLRWGFLKKDRRKAEELPSPVQEPAGEEWDFLREQPDFDADEMATVHSAPELNETRPGDEDLLLDEIPAPLAMLAELGTEFQGLMEPTQEMPLRPSVVLDRSLMLEVVSGGRPCRRIIRGRTVIGRRISGQVMPDIDLYSDGAVAPQHAVIELQNGEYWLQNLQAPKGILHNGISLEAGQAVQLGAGDEIQLGTTSRLRILDQNGDNDDLTAEDRMLAAMLNDALGLPRGTDPAAPGQGAGMARNEGGDVLDLALERGGENGLFPKARRFPDAFYDMRPPGATSTRRSK